MKCLLTLFTVLTCVVASADNVTEFRGPQRDGHFPGSGLLQAWPEGGPPLAWQLEGLGKGYSSTVLADDTLYTAGMLDDLQGYLFAIGLDGTLKYKAAYGPETEEKMATGSRATPTIDGDRIYHMSGLGTVYCLNRADGAVLWSADVATQFNAIPVLWAFSESPLVHGDLVYATPGGLEASIVALNKMTGEVVWATKELTEASAYCSPVLFELGGREILTTMLAESLVALDAKSGEVLFRHEQKVPYAIHANTPVVEGNRIFYTAETGGGVLEIAADAKSVTQVWTAKEPESLHHGVILHEGHLYGGGYKSRDLHCVDFNTGEVKWASEEIGEASIVMADGMLYLYESPKKGLVHLVKASPTGYERTGSLQVPKGRDKHWAHPAILDGHLFIRYDGTLYAYDVRVK